MKAIPGNLIFEKSLRIEATPDRIFAALTDSEKLATWFSEHANVNPTLHGCYCFWGKHTLWGKARESDGMYLTTYEADRALSFSWDLKGLATEVSITIKSSGGGCLLNLRHETLTTEPKMIVRHMLNDFWRIALLNLLWYIETGEPMTRMDYGDTRGDVVIDFYLAAPPGQIFQAITLPAKMDAWLSHRAKVELRPGGSYSFGWTEEVDGQLVPAGPTMILELEQDTKLGYGWSWPGQKDTRVSWELTPENKGTIIRLCHTGFTAKRDSTDYKQGWTAFLCQIRLYLQRGMRWDH